MKIIFWGTPEYAVPTLKSLHESNHEILAVVTQPDKKRRRGSSKISSPIKIEAVKNEIQVFTPSSITKDLTIQKELQALAADLYVVVAYGQILPANVLAFPKYGCWNGHASLLPNWRGAGPIQWAIIKGDKRTGVAIIAMEESLDTGPILIQKEITIQPNENYSQLSKRMSKLNSELMLEAIEKIENSINNTQNENYLSLIELTPQGDLGEEPSYARMINKQDYLISWDSSAIDIHRLVMGLYPNAYTIWKGKRLKVLTTILFDSNSNYQIDSKEQYGTIVKVDNQQGIKVLTGNGELWITKAQLEGKNTLSNNELIQQLKGMELKLFGKFGK
ncbi:methionyl-tRNA formyltransferase [Prochlorococcus sp. MIT 1341]|uniref:methionyl-tRNA formyltransferase n=1 Tax=Prochlorococcus sp. MIT 1341 TaxID=3096221 RepID=UPI002A75606E|nr:methionyl-tRNA formyltransferase [Prochlorococcus sp. MIT 1341]